MDKELHDIFYNMIRDFAFAEGLKVRWMNRAFNDALVDSYLRVSTLPVPVQLFALNGLSNNHKYLCQVSIYVRDGTGEEFTFNYSDKLRELFSLNTKLVGSRYTFTVTRPANPAPSIPMDGWFSTPVTFRVQAFS